MSFFGDVINAVVGANNESFNRGLQLDIHKDNLKLAKEQLALAEKEYYSNVDIANRNFGLQQQTFDYNKKQAELTRLREDNAFQRRVEDYVKSGFSPLAAQGVASSSQSPVLTAPQYDPSGVNQATANRLTAYQNAINSQNQTAQLKLQSQQLKLAQLETVKEMASSIFDLKGQILQNERLEHENSWYKTNGYRDTTYSTLLSNFINGFSDSFGGTTKDLGKWTGFKLQDGWNKMVKTALNLGFGGNSNNSNQNPIVGFLNKPLFSCNENKNQGYSISEKEQNSLFTSLSKARNGAFSPLELENLQLKLRRLFNGEDFGLSPSRWRSLSQKEYENILKQITERLKYNKY